jgi:raffinose/stachyose/melibiose transport system substrate-binding protein
MDMHRMIKSTLSFLIGCLFVFFLVGCQKDLTGNSNQIYLEDESTSSSKTQEIEITFFGFKADAMNLTAIETALQGYMKEHPSVRISYEGLKGSAYWDALDARSENNELDDIIMVHHDDVVRLKEEGKLADLSDLSTISNFSEMAQTQFTEEDGSVYFLPTQISTFGLYINYDLLKEYDIEIPTNWSEFATACDYFVEKGIVPIIGNNLNTFRSLMAAKSLYPIYQMEKPEEMIEKFNSGEEDIMKYCTAGIEMVGEMLDRGWFDKEEVLNTASTSDDLALFAEGKRPFLITGGWASQRLMALEPDFEYGIYPYPILENGSVLVMNVDTCISVVAQGEHVDTTKDFVEYFTQPDVIMDYCNTQSSYTPLKDNRTPSDKTIAISAEYLFNGQNVIGSDYRLNLPLDNTENEISTQMLKGMGTQEAIQKFTELIKQ